ncbi:MAG: hypothetical protein ACREMF_06720 [Gemmatimonadales bacterium]
MSASGSLKVVSLPVCALNVRLVDALWRLYSDHYDNVVREVFEADLANKQSVFVGFDGGSGEVKGFSTAVIYFHRYGGRTVGVYFSGDTIVHPDYWGQKALHKRVLRALLVWRLRHPLIPLYWFLICSGYRTYLTMVRTFPDHWPHHAGELPPWERGLIDSLGRERFGDAWKSERGVVSSAGPQAVVKRRVAPFTAQVLALPEIQFFVRANPGCERGDELAVIGRVNAAAYGRFALKLLRRWTRGLGLGAALPGRTGVSPR